MNAEKWQKVKELFNQAIEIETQKRQDFLESNCQDDPEIRDELAKLLAEDIKDETIFDPFISSDNSFTHSLNPIGKTIDRYQILSEIGEGGMGSVYLAERDELGDKVALKIVKKGMDTADLLRRFHSEQQILANLNHPNIARLLDNGKTQDGLPYYVMEYVEGETLLKFANKNGLSAQQRLGIFRKICSAIQYAHNRLVVHRDLKPSNILITKDLEPKLLDFGIAKVLSPEKNESKGTATLLGMMTPNYASPEQLRGETVTTASDIYSLGVILYELMTGKLPFNIKQFTFAEMMEVVSNTEPQTPSNVILEGAINQQYVSQIKGDIDNIILKALKKEPERRYLSAEQFSEDIRRHLEGLPVKARPDTFSYRSSKFIKRNKLGVAAIGLIFLSLIGGIIGTTYQKAKAEKRFEDLRQLSNRLIFKYNEAISNLPGAISTRAIFVQEATQFLDSLALEQSNDSQLQIELANAYLKVGDLQSEIGTFDTKQTLETYQKALQISEKLFASEPQNIDIKTIYASALMNVGKFTSELGIDEQVTVNLINSVKLREEILAADSENFQNKIGLVQSYSALGEYYQTIKLDLAKENFQKALQLNEKLINEPTATALEWRLFALTNQKSASILSPAEAVVFQNKAVDYFAKVLENKPNLHQAKQDYALALLKRSNLYKSLNNKELASSDNKKAIEIFENLLLFDPKNDELRRILSKSKGEKESVKSVQSNDKNETIKDDIFK